MDSLHKLTELFREFPGIGPRQAHRFVFFLLTKSDSYRELLASRIQELKKEITLCASCFRYFAKNKSALCSICSDKNRDRSYLMLVGKDIDLENIEKSHTYTGLYFVLGGVVPILENNPEEKIRTKELLNAVSKQAGEGLKEIILSMNLNPEGDNTADYLRSLLKPLEDAHGFKISALGRGLSTGTEIEYSDSDTIKNALKNRA